jgi:hypothetical protein
VLVPLDFKTPKEVDVDAVIAGIYAACRTTPTPEADQQLRAALAPFNLKKASRGGDKAALAAILEVFELPDDHEIAQLWQAMGKLHDKAHRNALAAPRKLDDVAVAWEVFQKLLSLLLTHLDAAWALVYQRIDSILSVQHPGKDQISRLRNKIPNNSNTFRYFFERATSNEWVAAITKDDSLFTDPPDIGPWPAITFLQRIAESHAADAHRITTQLPRTPNASIHMAIIAIANALPHELAKDLLASEATSFAEGDVHDDFIATDLAKAAARIGSSEPNTALQVFEKLLALQRPAGESIDDLTSPLDVHSYADVVTAVAELIASAPRAAYDMLANLLDAALKQAHSTPPDDGSNGWMPAIEPHEQNHPYDPLPHLAGAVRDAADACVRDDPASVAAIIEDAERREWFFFRRLALHLLRHDPTSPAARQRALDPDLLHRWWSKHEARLLIRAVFPHLHGDEQRRVIDEILRGPQDKREADEDGEKRREWWVAQRLWWIADWLPQDVRHRYDALVAQHGQPDETQDFIAWVGSMWVGPTSPKTAAELAQMDVQSIVEFLRAWQPPAGRSFEAPSREGVARELQTIATSRPREFASAAASFTGLDPTYVRGILNGLHAAVQNEYTAITWEPVVQLSRWIAEQPREIAGRVEDGWDDDDPHWGWARGAIARLFEVGFRDGASQIPIALREQVWSVIARITDDSDPSPEREHEHPSEPLSIAINSTRGQAIESVMWYARWVRVTTPEADRPTTFVDMPEVRDLLDEHLTNDRSVAIRALYGQFLPLLRALDQGWLAQNLARFFPSADPVLWAATWETYVTHTEPRLPIDRALLAEYDRAIDVLSAGGKPLYSHYPSHLARRVMWLFAADAITLDAGALVDRFFAAADADTRAYAVGFASHAVRDVVGKDDEAFRAKLASFWTWCCGKTDLAPALRGFGMWFHEEKLDLGWRLTQLERALTLAGHVMRDFEVMDDLAAATASHPQSALRCVRLLIDGADGMRVYAWALDGHLRRIITTAIEHGDATTIAEARAFANHLVGRGFDSFLDLAT